MPARSVLPDPEPKWRTDRILTQWSPAECTAAPRRPGGQTLHGAVGQPRQRDSGEPRETVDCGLTAVGGGSTVGRRAGAPPPGVGEGRVRTQDWAMFAVLLGVAACAPGQWGEIARDLGLGEPALTEEGIAAGLKEALRVGTENAAVLAAQPGGYSGNAKIRIPLPASLNRMADTLRAMGLGRQVEEFALSMNRAAEQAAPQATAIFVDAITAMTFEDARRVLEGQEDEATRYLKAKTVTRLYGLFRPVVHGSMEQIGVTRLYQALTTRYVALPLVRRPDLDLDHYVTVKSLDGLFHLLAEEERRIRTDPSARVTALLREVFAR